MTIKTDIDQLVTDAQKVHNWAGGSATHTETMGAYSVRSPAKLIADKDAGINTAANGVLTQATTQATNAATSANNSATSAASASNSASNAAASWTAALAANPDLNPFGRMNPSTITTNQTIASGYNAGSFGPITIAEGTTVTLNTNSNWSIL
jgi:hypothetical protein